MADSLNTGGNKQEMSMEMRLLLAFVLMGVVMYLSQMFFAPPPPPKKIASANPTAQASPQSSPADKAAATNPAPPAATQTATAPTTPAPNATPDKVEPHFVVKTDLFRVEFSNQGGTVRSWQLRKYHGNDGKPLELTNTAAGLEYPFSLYFPAAKPTTDVNWKWYKQTPDPDNLGVTYEYSDGRTSVRKVFRFQQRSYLTMVSTEVTLDGKPLQHLIQWRGGFGDFTVPSVAANQRTLFFDVAQNKLVEQTAKAASNGPVTNSGNFSFGGLGDNYFVAVFLAEGNNMTQVTFADHVKTPLEEVGVQAFTGVAVGDGGANRFELFVGPKDLDLLAKINPKLEQTVDFGWLSFLAKPLFLIVNYVNDHVVRNFGWSIVIVTIALNFILFPIKMTNMKSMKKMQALKPQIDAINAKYKNVGLRDPKKADQNQEIMDLYKKHGVNPMGGCVPMLLQIPFFIAFYKVFTVSAEMRGAPWLWVTDLSQPDIFPPGIHSPIHLLPIVMIASQFFMQKMTPQPSGDPAQQKMMMFMPLIFGFMFYSFPSGLVLYYLTSNLVSMGQQWFFNKTSLATVAAESVLPPKKTGRK
jgi:YidC/Oxa1 family membrane protein insertase